MRLTAISLTALLSASFATAQHQASIDLAGVQFRNATNQSRDSAPQTLAPGFAYTYDIQAMVRGDSGLLAFLYPNPTDLADVLDSFSPGASEFLAGEVYNKTAAHPFEVTGERFSGSANILGVNVLFEATVAAGIRADNIAYFSLTNVVISPAAIVGSMTATSGTATITRVPVITGDLNWDGSLNQFDLQPFMDALLAPAQYEAAYGHDPRITGDCNRDGTMSGFDIQPFVELFMP